MIARQGRLGAFSVPVSTGQRYPHAPGSRWSAWFRPAASHDSRRREATELDGHLGGRGPVDQEQRLLRTASSSGGDLDRPRAG